MADATDLKSEAAKAACGFKSRSGYQKPLEKGAFLFGPEAAIPERSVKAHPEYGSPDINTYDHANL